MSKYYFCKAGQRLRNELNASNSKRDKSSDGWIGDADHAARKSDHNPDYAHGGVVLAFDADNDGIDPDRLVQVLIKDFRVNYVIWNGHIWSRQYNFKKRVYTGKSPHKEHVHVSFLLEHCNDGRPFGYYPKPKPKPAPTPARTHDAQPAPVHKGTTQIAQEVIDGKWGDGDVRVRKLRQAGYRPEIIQREVNRLLSKR